jgi:hypothetical protein
MLVCLLIQVVHMGITELSNILVFAPMNQRALPWLVPAFNA